MPDIIIAIELLLLLIVYIWGWFIFRKHIFQRWLDHKNTIE